jgi:DNA-binding SARP family transcriptional activator/basic membrane lipoprotein Med (substrate-binding protein (PBP1-ABC) superfamily)
MVAFRMLGALEATGGGVRADLGPPKQRALLALLLLHPNEIVPVDVLVDGLWGDEPPRQAQHAVQVYVSDLRRALAPLGGGEVLAWRSPGYVLSAGDDEIDARRFERLAAEGTRESSGGDPARAAALLREALGLWHGPPLADVAYEEFAQPAIRRLTEVHLAAGETLAGLDLAAGRDAEALPLAESVVAEDPLRERARERQMLALYRRGRAADALRAYDELRRGLADEIGAAPSPSVRDLQERILLHDPSLGGPRAASAGGAAVEARNPFKGLRPFGEEDAADFFGREALVARLLEAVEGEHRLVALVGPSGSGKSSVLHAGFIPALRAAGGDSAGTADRSVVATRPGARPVEALETALAASAGPLVIVIDQLEELFGAGEEDVARFLACLADAVEDPAGQVRAVVALRADAYDRPLLHARFAPLFLAGVVNVVPMSPGELEDAITGPADRAGAVVEPALLAELITAVVDRPGALPSLQHTLAELFDRRSRGTLTLAAYRALGGLRASLARRAEEILAALDEERQGVARQVFLRLVRTGDGRRDTLRRVPAGELTALELDSVALSDVLIAFDRGRLLSFDRDESTGAATVEIAHEALLAAWERLAGWIVESGADLAQRSSLAQRAAEWTTAGRRPEDLLAGARLGNIAAWSRTTSLRLTADERDYLDASLVRRDAEVAAESAQVASIRRLEGRARLRLAGLVGVVALLVVGGAWALLSWPGPAPDVVLVYPGFGDSGVDDSVSAGFDAAVASDGLEAQVVVEDESRLEDRLRRLASQGVDLLVVGYPWGNPEVERAARDNPGTRFLTIDYHGELPNVSMPLFARQEGAFLVGAAAALQSRSGTVGVVACDSDHGWPYAAGFAAGAQAADPAARVLVSYLRCNEVVGIVLGSTEGLVRDIYRQGADVVFYAGTGSPLGAFETAYAESEAQDRQLWAVGLDTDWYVVLPLVRQAGAASWRPHVLTSLVTRYDLAVGSMLDEYAAGSLAPGWRRFGLAEGAFDLADSGGFIDASLATLSTLRERVIAGSIEVPALPADRGPPR